MGQRDQAVKPQVSHFADQLAPELGRGAAVVNVFGGHHGFGSFLAYFFEKSIGALVK